MQLASCVVIYSHIQLHRWSAEPITDNQGIRGCLTQLVNQPQLKQTEHPLALIHTWIVSGLMWLLNGDKRCVLKWCAYTPCKTPFGKSGHILYTVGTTSELTVLLYAGEQREQFVPTIVCTYSTMYVC